MFDLEQAITNWKSGFAHVESMTGEHRQELEGHLRDTIPNLVDSGLSEEEAFLVATKRLGHPANLELEYAKVNGSLVWQKRILWMLLGYVGVGACGALLGGLSSIGAGVAAMIGTQGATAGATSLVVQLIGWTTIFSLMYRSAVAKSELNARDSVSVKLCLAIVFTGICGNALAMGARVLHIKFSTPTQLGESYMWIGVGSYVIHVGVMLACIIMIYLLGRTNQRELEVTS